jgi:transcriptional regulator with XRE-family HTH domain
MTDIPIKPDLITWAREHRGLSQEQAADKLGMTVNDFADLERGTKTPNLEFFKRLSSRLKIPSGTLLRQTRPNVRPLPTDFRTIEGREPERYPKTFKSWWRMRLPHHLHDCRACASMTTRTKPEKLNERD